ncbi:4-(cytidine 5'-diphospho)-2-C-methyl-D-erythritol kinase [Anaerosalibacter sp. Marseille-P3206]|uniref:4-(cytidine 5'-diphospho)-2-C-methyl-D-erythritol kinase n=1 Tax=Anaerosalibacter sp. Marseille-P3206 TaxID=1871005 RepID=UPI001F3B61F2|nr:4-(cytidine 5'-diphospho)-2-C-methyl-D-erythritol kinase [Anaerosalibacter sp. Marseille-P3206]
MEKETSMESITLEAYGKINLSLDVLGKRIDGYHDIETIMQSIDLKDKVVLRDSEEGITIECNNPQVPTDSTNLVYKAYRILRDMYSIKRGVHIKIQKNIPVAAGLAGGSTNAAATLIGLNELWGLKLSKEKLMNIGVKIGADVPFCIMGGTALAKGIGEELISLKDFSGHLVLLANIGIEVSTAHVYSSLKIDNIANRPNMDKLLLGIDKNDLNIISENMVNVLEEVTIGEHGQIQDIKNEMLEFGALGSLMSGSGPTVFGFFDNEEDLLKCKKSLEKKVKTLIITKTI